MASRTLAEFLPEREGVVPQIRTLKMPPHDFGHIHHADERPRLFEPEKKHRAALPFLSGEMRAEGGRGERRLHPRAMQRPAAPNGGQKLVFVR